MSGKNKKLFTRCYLLALFLWILSVLFGFGKGAYFTAKGLYETKEVMLEELTMVSAKPFDHSDYPGGGWFVTTDTDPQLLWEGDLYLDRVVLTLRQESLANGVELYYLTGSQTDWTPRQLIYAVRDGEGRYIFDLGGKHVTALRIDPDSQGGVLTQFQGLTFNAPRPFWMRLLPSMGQAVLLLLLPSVAAALYTQIKRWIYE